MDVEAIDNVAGLERIEAPWEAVYAADPEAQYFLSWSWVSERLKQIGRPWTVLAARPSGRKNKAHVAFLPLVLRTQRGRDRRLRHSIVPAGSGMADYTGVICTRQHERKALAAFARHLSARRWAELRLLNLDCSAGRVRAFTHQFDKDRFIVALVDATNPDGVDNAVCPYIPLPSSFDGYLTSLSANTRQKLRRLLRGLEADPDLQISETTADTFDRDLSDLIEFWSQRWADRKGSSAAAMTRNIGQMVLQAQQTGALFMPVLRHHGETQGVLACFRDPKKRRILFYVSGRRLDWAGSAPGLLLHAYSIRCAIAQGYEVYDFLRGNEAYKFSLGAADRRITNLSILRADEDGVRTAFGYARQLARVGKHSEAASLLRQLLHQDDRNVAAMLLLARVQIGLNDPRPVRVLLERAMEVAPEDTSVWRAHGGILEMQALYEDALQAYERVIALDPHDLAAQFARGRTLRALGKRGQALAAFRRLREVEPGLRGVSSAIAELEATTKGT